MLFEAGEAESQSHNRHCFAYLHEEDRTTVSFQICPPTLGKFILRNPIDSDGHCANFSITAYTLIHKRKWEFALDTFSWKELFSSLEKLQPLIKLIQ